MSRNGAGVYSLAAGNPVVTGTTISSTTYNNTLTDIASALTQSVSSDGQTSMTGALAMGSNKITGLADGTLVTDVPSISQVLNGSFIYVGTVGGTGDVITLTPSPAIASYAGGQTFRFIAGAANTTNVTVNVSGKGAKAVTKNGTTALVANDILLGALITVTYDGTQFQMVPSTNLLATDSAVIHNTLTTTTGDMIYASSANTPARLAVGAAGTVLVGGTTPSYFTGVSFAAGGLQVGSPTGGAKGANTLNVASGVYDGGNKVYSSGNPVPVAGLNEVSCLLQLSVSVSVGNSAAVAVGWDSEVYDPAGLHDNVVNNSRVTVPAGFIWAEAAVNGEWASNSTGERVLGIQKNGADIAGGGLSRISANSVSVTTQNVKSGRFSVVATDYLNVSVLQTSGGALNLDAAATTWFWVKFSK